MSEETIKMLNIINDKVKKFIKDNNVDTILYIPIGGHAEFGYLTDKMLNEIIKLQQEKYNLIEYLENKINQFKEQIKNFDIWHEVGVDLNFLILQRQWYQDILERLKSVKYE